MDEQLILKFPALLLMFAGLGFVFHGINYLRGKKSFQNCPLTRDVVKLNIKLGIGALIFGLELILCMGVFVFNGPAIYFLILLFLIVFSSGILLLVVISPKARLLKERYGSGKY